jgi:hypothetical protein
MTDRPTDVGGVRGISQGKVFRKAMAIQRDNAKPMTDKVQEEADWPSDLGRVTNSGTAQEQGDYALGYLWELARFVARIGYPDEYVSILVCAAAVQTLLAAIKERDERIERLTAAVRMNDSIVDDLQYASYQRDQYRAEVEQLRKVADWLSHNICVQEVNNGRLTRQYVHEVSDEDAERNMQRALASLPQKEG